MLTNFSRTFLALGLVVANANAIAGASPARAGETTLRYRLSAGSTLTVKTIAGFIHITRGSGDTVVHAVAHPGDGGTIDMHVAQDRSTGSWTLCEVPLDVTSCSASEGSHDTNTHGHVDLTISVPAGVKLAVTSVSGDVAVTGATENVAAKSVSGDVRIVTAGDASAASVSGNVTISTGGNASAKTVSGNVDAHLGTLRGSTSFDSVSGTIALALPHASNADVSAKTLSGAVTGGAGVRFTDDQNFVGHTARATIGRGGTPIGIQTVSGSIDVTTI